MSCRCKKLDDVLDNEFNGEDIIIKFIKIDTEGNDGNVIKGLKNIYQKLNILYLNVVIV